MPGAHEAMEHHEHAEHAAHAEHGASGRNKRIALLISLLALCLAFSETLGKSAQTEALSYNVEASNLWAFFQAKTIRRTLVQTAAEEMKVSAGAATDPAVKAAMTKQVDDWNKTAARYRSEPETKEGSVELAERAKQSEHKRDTSLARYHHYEVASAAFQIGIVLASATIITGMVALSGLALATGVIGLVFMGIGLFAPHAVHLM